MKRLTLLFLLFMGVASGNTEPHHEPIVFSEPPKPNIMMVLDSSASMLFFDMDAAPGYDEKYARANFASYHNKPWQLPTNHLRNPECYYSPYHRINRCDPANMQSGFLDQYNTHGKYSRRAVLLWTVNELIKEYGDKTNIGFAALGDPNRTRSGNYEYYPDPSEELYDKIFMMPSHVSPSHSRVLNFYQAGAYGGTPLNHSVYKASALMRGLTTDTKKMSTPTITLRFTPAAQYRCQEQHLILLTDGQQNIPDINLARNEWRRIDYQQNAFDNSDNSKLGALGAFLQSIDVRDDILRLKPTSKDLAGQEWKTDAYSASKMPITTHAIRFGTESGVKEDDKYLRMFVGQTYIGPSGKSSSDALKEENWDKNTAWGVFAMADDTSALKLAFNEIFQNIINSRSGTGRAKSQSNVVTDSGVEYATSYTPGSWKSEITAYGYDEKSERFTRRLWSTEDSYKIEPNQGQFYTFNGTNRINLDDSNIDKKYISWLKGNQVSGLRPRAKLGDIIDSHITYAYKDSLHINLDKVHSSKVELYLDYLYKKNLSYDFANYLIAGSNDGLLNILYANENSKRGKAIDSEGKEIWVNRGGQRRYSYFPSFFKSDLASMTKIDFQHLYAVNGTTHLFDAMIGNGFYTIGITGMGAGKKGLVGYTTYSTIRGVDFRVNFELTRDQLPGLGYTYSDVEFFNRQTEFGPQAVAVFGNGYNPGGASFVYLIDAHSGKLLSKVTLPGEGGASSPATEVSVTPIDAGGFQRLERIYVGDHSGKLYRIRFKSDDLNDYQVNTLIDLGSKQPITVRPAISHDSSNVPWIYFGTGRAITLKDADSVANNGFYAVKDRFNFTLEETLKEHEALVSVEELHRHRVISQDTEGERDGKYYVTTTNTRSEKTENGWYLELNGKGERVIYPARILSHTYIVFPTYGIDLSLSTQNDPCIGGGFYGKMMMLSLYDGRSAQLYQHNDKRYAGYYLNNDAPGIPSGANLTIGNDEAGNNPRNNLKYYDLEKLRSENSESQYEGEKVPADGGSQTLKDNWDMMPDIINEPAEVRDLGRGRLYLRNI